jgi:predicted RNA binding protein YcfA (HicA-like mRNA interferase family)
MTKIKDIIKLIESDGWYLITQRGSHRQYKHLTKKGRVTIPGKPSDDVYPKLEQNILKQAGLR